MWAAQSKSVLLSKTVWTAVAGVAVAMANVLGYHLADAQLDQGIDLLLFVLTGLFRLTATQPVHVVDSGT